MRKARIWRAFLINRGRFSENKNGWLGWKDSNLDMTNLKSDLHEQDEEHVADDRADEEDDEQEIAPPRPRNTRTIEIERFLPAGQIDARYFEKAYYIVPREEIGQESFAVNSVHCPRSASSTKRPMNVSQESPENHNSGTAFSHSQDPERTFQVLNSALMSDY